MSRRAFLFGLLIAGLLIVSLYRAKYGARDTAAELMAVEARIEDARREKSLLDTELSHMSRREWIEEYAREELGMAPPQPQQMIRELDLGRFIGEPGAMPVAQTLPPAEEVAVPAVKALPAKEKNAPPKEQTSSPEPLVAEAETP